MQTTHSIGARDHVPVGGGSRNSVLDLIESTSTTRLFAVWLGIILLCACAYWLVALTGNIALIEKGNPIRGDLNGLSTAVYFSFTTALSVGYGDVLPVGPARGLAVAEAVAGLLIFGVLIAKFVSRHQDELVREIHRITFEDRLDRVQTNLHLVLSEMQSISITQDINSVASPRIGARLESATLVFTGELRTIHALLSRPQRALEGQVLEAILAALHSSLRALRDVLTCQPPAFDHSPTLDAALRTLSQLAQTICRDCVPEGHAPALTVWIDRIEKTAHELV